MIDIRESEEKLTKNLVLKASLSHAVEIAEILELDPKNTTIEAFIYRITEFLDHIEILRDEGFDTSNKISMELVEKERRIKLIIGVAETKLSDAKLFFREN